MPQLEITVRSEFCAALRLHRAEFSESRNDAVYGVCHSPHGHGHNYLLEVTVAGPLDPATGLVVDFLELQGLVDEHLVRPVDHRNLNVDVDFLANRVPTSENLLVVFWERLAGVLPEALDLLRMRLQESRDHWVLYRGPRS